MAHSKQVQQRRCYSSLLSPIRRLPIEIFGKIFVYATCDRPSHVLNISAVCQLWRNAALLWSTLEIGHHTSRHNMDNYIASRIERAHSFPLSLVIKKQQEVWDAQTIDSVLALIPKYRWKSIILDSSDHTNTLSILKMLEFSNLEMLENFSLTPRDYSKLSLPNALQHASELTTLTLKIFYPVSFDILPIPWRQLTSLTIRLWNNVPINILDLDILQACVKLEEFIIGGKLMMGRSRKQ